MFFINTDASIQPFNPGGIVAWAFIVKAGKKVVHKDCGVSVRGGEMATGNVGEYHAVVAAMLWLVGLPKEKKRPAIIRSDSQLIVNQCAGMWNVNDEKLQPLHKMIMDARRQYGLGVTFKWISRDKNEEADALSRTAYDPKEIQWWKDNQLDLTFGDDDLPF